MAQVLAARFGTDAGEGKREAEQGLDVDMMEVLATP